MKEETGVSIAPVRPHAVQEVTIVNEQTDETIGGGHTYCSKRPLDLLTSTLLSSRKTKKLQMPTGSTASQLMLPIDRKPNQYTSGPGWLVLGVEYELDSYT